MNIYHCYRQQRPIEWKTYPIIFKVFGVKRLRKKTFSWEQFHKRIPEKHSPCKDYQLPGTYICSRSSRTFIWFPVMINITSCFEHEPLYLQSKSSKFETHNIGKLVFCVVPVFVQRILHTLTYHHSTASLLCLLLLKPFTTVLWIQWGRNLWRSDHHINKRKHNSIVNRNMTGSFLTSFLLLLELILLFVVLFVIVWHVRVRCLMVMTIVWWWWLAGAVQPWKLGGTDFLGAGGASHAPWVLSPALLCRAAAGGQEALSHGWCPLIKPLAAGTSPLHHTCSRQTCKILTQHFTFFTNASDHY